jgi:hypothetical protein
LTINQQKIIIPAEIEQGELIMRRKNQGINLKRSACVMVRLFPEEKELFKQLALMEKFTFSELIRDLIRERARERGLWK